jgi:hypothetical protein
MAFHDCGFVFEPKRQLISAKPSAFELLVAQNALPGSKSQALSRSFVKETVFAP